MLEIRQLDATEGRQYLRELAVVLLDCVEGGASVSFLASLSRAEAESFFAGVLEGVQRGERILLAAFLDSQLVGTVQVLTAMPPNQPHRADIAKLLVLRSARGKGVGRRLMESAEEASMLAGKTLLVLDTATGDSAETLYVRLRWNRVGVIPGYAIYPNGTPCDTTIFWKELPKPMIPFRIALANLAFATTPEESIALAEHAIKQASLERADVICFPECFIPGYRSVGRPMQPPDGQFLERAWTAAAAEAAKCGITAILGTERIVDDKLLISTLVINRDGTMAGFQDKVQLDPSEEATYSPGTGRHIFHAGPLTFGIAICHEGWRYPETVRWAAQRGAQIVFHPQFHEAEAGSYRSSTFADPGNSFHEKAALCRAAENTCYFATVNYASAGSPTTSAVVNPDGTLLTYQPYGRPGLLIADVDLTLATGLLARRYKQT